MYYRVTRADINYRRAVPSGAWILSALIGGYYVSRQYIGYTKADATRLFLAEYR